MPQPRPSRARPPSLRLKIGDWIEAQATGWAVVLVPLLVALLVVGALLR